MSLKNYFLMFCFTASLVCFIAPHFIYENIFHIMLQLSINYIQSSLNQYEWHLHVLGKFYLIYCINSVVLSSWFKHEVSDFNHWLINIADSHTPLLDPQRGLNLLPNWTQFPPSWTDNENDRQNGCLLTLGQGSDMYGWHLLSPCLSVCWT